MTETLDVFEILKKIIIDTIQSYNGQEVLLDSTVESLGGDQLDVCNIVDAVNEKFGIEIPEVDADIFFDGTIRQIMKKIEEIIG